MSEKEILGAGGVVMNEAGEVLLVHRPQYNDWSFPKGKVDEGESLTETAIREVREETGLECDIIRPLANIRYSYTTREGEVKSKVVQYFLMRVIGGALSTDGKETDEAVWCNLEEAGAKLSYSGNKEVLRGLTP